MKINSKVSLRSAIFISVAALFILSGMYYVAAELYRRGTFVDDTRYAVEIHRVSARYGVDPQLVRAVIFQESRFRSDAVGKKSEAGLMQVLQNGAVADWARLNRRKIPSHSDLLQVDLNLEIGVWYLARALKRWEKYKDQIPLALIQYNAGEGRAERWKPDTENGEVLPRIKIASTRSYVMNIMKRYQRYLSEK